MTIDNNKRCNELTGKEWLQNSFSIWRDISKTKEEKQLSHPASYPVALCEKVIKTFTPKEAFILDPFVGTGSTMVAASLLGKSGVGIDLSADFIEMAKVRVDDAHIQLINNDSFAVVPTLEDASVDLCLTSPPYWDILNMKHSADRKESINYSDESADLGNISSYPVFIDKIGSLFAQILPKLKDKGYCIVNVMDIRKKNQFYPLHIDITEKLQQVGYTLDDIIIWDRQKEYNNMRPLGYPYKFRINKVHEYLLIFTK